MTAAGSRTCIGKRESNKTEGEEGNHTNVVVMVVVVVCSSSIHEAVLK